MGRDWDNAKIDNGAALIAMHGRTKEQKYNGQASWDAIAALKQAVTVPVIGNGDIECAADIDTMLDYTDCDAVMIGRGAIGNPWIFAQIDRSELALADVLQAVRIHSREMMAYYGEGHGLIQFRKHLKRYLADAPQAQSVLPEMLQMKTAASFADLLAEIKTAVSRPLAPESLPVR